MPNLGLGLGTNLLRSAATGFPYPKAGRVLDLGAFTYTNAEVSDRSGEDNEAVLYSGRGVNLAGADYVELPDVGATKSITVLARSSTDTTLYATDDAAQTEDATAALVADGTWQEVTLTFTNAISGKIRLGSDGTSFFSGDLADARCKDASGNLLDQFYLNEHTDTAAAGLDGLPVIGRNGNIGQYVNCAAVVQEGFDSALAGLGAYGDKLWFDGVDDSIDMGSEISLSGDFSFKFNAVRNGTANEGIVDNSGNVTPFIRFTGLSTISIRTDGNTLIAISLDSALVVGVDYSFELLSESGVLSLKINGITQSDTEVISEDITINRVGRRAADWFNGIYFSFDFGNGTTWDGTESDAIANGWTVNGSPNTVAELRTTPPQVLGMDFNQYRWFNGVDTEVAITKLDFGTGNWRVGAEVIIEDTGSPNPILGDGANWVLQLSTSTVLACRTNLDSEIFNISLDSAYVAGTKVKFEIERSGNTLYAYVDGLQQAATVACDATDTFACDTIGNRGAVYFNGLIFNADINGAAAYSGRGDNPWQDTIGSNDGTESGTFENVLVPESLNKGIDALGNAITPRTNKTFNADGSGYGLVPDDDSLDLTTEATWVMKGNFYGTGDEYYLSKYKTSSNDRAWGVGRESAESASEFRLVFGDPVNGTFEASAKFSGLSNENGFLVITFNAGTLKAYWNGLDLGAPTPILGAVPSSLYVSTEPIYIAGLFTSGFGFISKSPISDVKIYNRALNADEIAKFS